MSFMKMMTLMGRLYGAFYAVIFMGLSGLKAADNVANNDLVKFLLEFCFDPNTVIQLADGTAKRLSEINIGDVLESIDDKTPIVSSIFRFDGSSTPMVRLQGVHVSAEHFVFYKNTWIKASEHPESVSTESIPELVCLNTDTHVLKIRGIIFSDYDESDDATVVSSTQALAEMLLNSGTCDTMNVMTRDYELGISSETPIVYKNGFTKAISEVQIGDEILGSGIVKGLIKENCHWVTLLPNGLWVSASQLIWDNSFNLWRRAAHIYPEKSSHLKDGMILYQLSVTNNLMESVDCLFRDYREVNDPEMENAYEKDLTKKLNNESTNDIVSKTLI